MHAGDAKGVPHPQGDFFRVNESTTTPAMFERLSEKYGFPVLLCEKDKKSRASLAERFEDFAVAVIGDHAKAPDFIEALNPRPGWAVCISDPNGHGSLGVEHMARLGRLIPRMDFVIVYPQGSMERVKGVCDNWRDRVDDAPQTVLNCFKSEEVAGWMLGDELDKHGDFLPSPEWVHRLDRSRMAVTRVINASRNFRYRVMVVSNYLPQGITRDPLFQEISR